MDNFQIDVSAKDEPDLIDILKVVLRQHRRVEGYRIAYLPSRNMHTGVADEEKVITLILYWHVDDYLLRIREGLKRRSITRADRLARFIMRWLLEDIEFPKMDIDDEDVSEEKGWRVFNQAWGHVDNDAYAFLAIQPRWCWYGK